MAEQKFISENKTWFQSPKNKKPTLIMGIQLLGDHWKGSSCFEFTPFFEPNKEAFDSTMKSFISSTLYVLLELDKIKKKTFAMSTLSIDYKVFVW